jgi:excisionase family DNA binding protein
MTAATVTLPKLLSPAELGEYLGVPVQTVYAWRDKGTGPRALKVGKHLRYRTSDVEIWLDQQAAS